MHSPFRTVLLGVNVLVFALLVVVGTPAAVKPAVASPVPFVQNSDYALQPYNTSSAVLVKHVQEDSNKKRDSFPSVDATGDRKTSQPRDINTVLGDINILNNYYTQMSSHAANFRQLSQHYESTQDFNTQSADEVTAFRENLGGFQDVLAQLGADKGLANYNSDDALETLLKNVVNANKYLLSDVDEMVYKLPAVGGILGPLVYDIKCILDETLDALENLTDAIINAIEPILQGIISDASRTACNSGIAVVGLCILP